MSELSGDTGTKRSLTPHGIEEPELKKPRVEVAVDEAKAANTGKNENDVKAYSISSDYSDIVSQLEKVFSGSLDAKDVSTFVGNQSQMILEPFKVMELKNFIQDDGSVQKLSEMISTVGKLWLLIYLDENLIFSLYPFNF